MEEKPKAQKAEHFGILLDELETVDPRVYEDSLTGTFNRRYFDENRYIYEMARSLPSQLGFYIVDICHFSRINDIYGRTHGDELLSKVGDILVRSVRGADRVMRLEGDQFLIVIRDCNKKFLDQRIHQIRQSTSEITFDWLNREHISLAIGMSYTDCFNSTVEQLELLYDKAYERMLENKSVPPIIAGEKTILVVDDLEMNRKFIAVLLAGYHVIEAESGRDALVILKTNHVDLVITDIFMSDIDGYELMKTIRENEAIANIPIIAITENNESSQAKAMASGADIYIEQPVSKDELSKFVVKLTGHDHGRRELIDMDFVLNSIPGAVVVYQLQGEGLDILSCSRGISVITGWDSDEFCDLVRDKAMAMVHPADQEKFMALINKIVRIHSQGEVIYRGFRKDGSVIWLWFQGRYIGEEDGCPIVQAIILDVSNSTSMYQEILDEVTSMITVIDAASYEILYANQSAIAVTDKEPGEYVGSICYQYIAHGKEPCKHCIIGNHKMDFMEQEVTYGDRSYRLVYKKILWNGRPALLEYSNDITEQKQLQKYNENAMNDLREMVQNVPAGLFVFQFTNEGLRLEEANPSACELMGIDPDKTIGSGMKHIVELTHPEDVGLITDTISKLSVPGRVISYEYRQFNKERQEYRWLSAQGHSVKQKDGRVLVYVSYFDITEEKRAQQLEADLRIAERESRAKSDFMSNMSHDMRTPLNGILGLSELMLEKDNVDELHADIEQLKVSGELLLRLINDTLDMNKMEAGQFRLDEKPMDSAFLFKNVMTTVSVMANQNMVEMVYDLPEIPEDKWIPVIADASRVEQILLNVISNAIKYSNPGSKVELHMRTLSVTEDTVTDEYCVVDHGIGMSKEFIPHLFEPFIQEGRKNTSRNQGSGLGMSIVKRLVDLMGGEIIVDSELNQGTSVTIRLSYPIYKGAHKAKDEHKASINEALLEGKKVLLCEDHPLNKQIMRQLLQKKKVDVMAADNGKIGLDMFRDSEPFTYDLILMDVRMPIMDGLEATKAIRGLNRTDAKEIPIIALTANAFKEDKEETKAAGMNEHLAKPVSPKVLYETLAKYLG